MLTKNSVVKIYTDPYTRTELEGEAVLLKHLDTYSTKAELWVVRFVTPEAEGCNVERLIVPEGI